MKYVNNTPTKTPEITNNQNVFVITNKFEIAKIIYPAEYAPVVKAKENRKLVFCISAKAAQASGTVFPKIPFIIATSIRGKIVSKCFDLKKTSSGRVFMCSLFVDGESLNVSDVFKACNDIKTKISISDETKKKIVDSKTLLDEFIDENRVI